MHRRLAARRGAAARRLAAAWPAALAAWLAAPAPIHAQQGEVRLEARGGIVFPVGAEFGDFADPGPAFGGGAVLFVSSRVSLSGSIDVSYHEATEPGGDDWTVLVVGGEIAYDLIAGPSAELAASLGAGVARFDPDPGSGFLRALTPFALSAGARLAVPVGARVAIVGRAAWVAAGLFHAEAPGPDGSFLVPLAVGMALRL